MTKFGIRHTADLEGRWADYVIDSVAIANDFAPDGMSFYFDTVDVAQQVIDGKHCWDMYGWLVSDKEKDSFEDLWLNDVDDEITQKYVLVTFENHGGTPAAVFE